MQIGPDPHNADYERAVGILVLSGRGSTSFIQRKLGIGYNAAARLIERAEAEGILAPPNHVGKREVLVRYAQPQPDEAKPRSPGQPMQIIPSGPKPPRK